MYPHSIIDLHCDTLTGCLDPGRCVDTLNDPCSQLSLSTLPQGTRWAQCCAIFIPDRLRGADAVRYYEFYQRSFVRQTAVFSARMAPCRTAGDIEQAWRRCKMAALLTVENGSALAGDLDRVETLARDGVRMMTLSWNGQNEIASGWDTAEGLTDFGRAVIPAMEERCVLADVSHLNDRSFFEALEVLQKPFVASHSNARAVCSHRRNLTDDQIREMVSRKCLIGLNYADKFLRDSGGAALDDLFRHVAHFLELGAEDCLALGSDFDGADIPPCLDSPKKAAGLYGYFLGRGLSRELCDKILFGNALAFFRANLG